MTDFKIGDLVYVSQHATYRLDGYDTNPSSVADYEGVVVGGPDEDGNYDVEVCLDNGSSLKDAVQPFYLMYVFAETPARADDAVEHPSHYGGGDNPYEAIKVIEAWGLGFSLGNAVKYISRAGKKNPDKELEDLKKARWYVEREINRLESKDN